MKSPLENKVIEIIRTSGPITFERFMDMALYDPGYGYYMSERLDLGRAGDFYTSGHLHPVFGAMIGRQVEEIWTFMGRPDDFTFVEIGGGTGHISKDMLDYLKDREIFGPLRHIIVEINPSMKAKQTELLSGYEGKVSWVSSAAELSDICGCIFSNELIDAFPVHIVVMDDDLKEIYIDVIEGALTERHGPLSITAIADYFEGFGIILEKGYRTEVNLRAGKWLDDISRGLSEGFVITVDYGYNCRDYFSEDRNRGTLMCYHKHEANEDPLQSPGTQDITSHVNFSSLKRWGEERGLKTIGFTSQGAYLASLGIDEEINKLSTVSTDYLSELGRIKKLILPQGMGDSHMVLAQYKGEGNPVLKGFTLSNRLRGL